MIDELTIANVVTAFQASPLLPEPDKLRFDHISAHMAMTVDGDAQNAAIRLLAPRYSQTVPEKV